MIAGMGLAVFVAYLCGAWAGERAGWRYGRRALMREVQDGGDMEAIVDAERRS